MTGGERTPDIDERGRFFSELTKSYDFWIDHGLAIVGSPETVHVLLRLGCLRDPVGLGGLTGSFLSAPASGGHRRQAGGCGGAGPGQPSVGRAGPTGGRRRRRLRLWPGGAWGIRYRSGIDRIGDM